MSDNQLVGKKGTGTFSTTKATGYFECDKHEEIMGPDVSGVLTLANAIKDMGALSVLNLASNNLGEIVPAAGWRSKDDDNMAPWVGPEGQEQDKRPGKPEGIIAITNAIPDMRAILSVSLLENNISPDQAKDLASILKEHPTLKSLCGNRGDETELNMSGRKMGADGAIMLAAEIAGNEALTSLTLSANELGQKVVPEGWSHGYHGDYSGGEFWKHTDGRRQKENLAKAVGIVAITNAIPDMRAILSVNLLKNSIGVDQAKDLLIILKEHPTLKSLCGNKGNETELDMSGKMNGTADAIMLAAEVVDNGALTALNLANNNIGELPTGWKADKNKGDERPIYQPLGGAWQFECPKLEGVIAIANAIPDMGAMTSLNLASNKLGVEGAKIIAACLPKCT
jgi:hypothetical protein